MGCHIQYNYIWSGMIYNILKIPLFYRAELCYTQLPFIYLTIIYMSKIIKCIYLWPQVQREGDELDAKIKRTEAELVALENTCEVLKLNNEEYRRNLLSPLETEEDVGPK